VKPCKHSHLLTLLQSHLPLSYTHRDAFGRDLARKCSGVNFIFQKNYFYMWSAKTSPFAHQKTMSGTQATLRVFENVRPMRQGQCEPVASWHRLSVQVLASATPGACYLAHVSMYPAHATRRMLPGTGYPAHEVPTNRSATGR